MKTGLLWYDDNPSRDLAEKIGRAARRYRQKFGTAPNVCYVHPSSLPAEACNVGNIEVKAKPPVLKDHFWIGIEEKAQMVTEQMKMWTGQFGQDYTDRNILSLEEEKSAYKKHYGQTRAELNEQFLEGIDRSTKILEVGSGAGNQLMCLQAMGFTDLYGIELQGYAVELAKMHNNINIIKGSVFDISYSDGYFGLVFTSGLLIHISPANIAVAMREIHRCSQAYIWGFEYYADKHTEIPYRGQRNLLWKANFAKLYLDRFDGLELVKETRLKRPDNNTDTMFLLRKKGEQNESS